MSEECIWVATGEDVRCRNCGTVRPYARRRRCGAVVATMKDYILRGTTWIEVLLFRRPCKHLGERTDLTTKTNCETVTYAPVYRCATYRFASPFAKSVDPDLIHNCESCEKYEAQL